MNNDMIRTYSYRISQATMHGALDRCGFRADNGDQPRRSDHIAKSDIDELHR